ncbi:histidine kinase [Actinoplanes sp. NPDC023801]|uniref:sensor histidine kinase n=1 Tax=Actinoplanes sp. NPDC023801 TaxID=3154595 RepID=UPI0033FB36D6
MQQRTFLAARAARWARQRPGRLDALSAALTWTVLGPLSVLVAGVTGLVLATVTIAPLAVRRRFPAVVLGCTTAAFALQLLLVPIPLPANAAQAIVVYTVAAHVAATGVRLTALALAVTGCLAGAFRWSTPPQQTRNALVIGVTLAICSVLIWVIGELVRGARANTAALHDARLQLARQRRVSAAAEIHDIVAHSLTVVIVQADAGAYAAGSSGSWRAADAAATLTTIAGTARTALAEVRGVIEMLQEPGPAEPAGAEVGRDDVRRLIDSVRTAGLPVRADVPDWFDELPAAVRLAVLRSVREALTNVLKHTGAGVTARLAVEREGDAIRLRVEDDGPARPAPGGSPPPSGHGLAGLRERLRGLDGVLTAGPLPEGGFRVAVTIPRARGGER